MRKDILESITEHLMTGIKPNFADVARHYNCDYRTVKRYARLIRESCKYKSTIRIETTPGLSAQVDWKENLKLISRNVEVFTINIFLYILEYSRMKYLPPFF